MNEDGYLDFVIKSAVRKGKIFILDSGEGNDQFDAMTKWYIEDLSGWLIPPEQKEVFLTAKKNGTVYECFSDCYVFAKWQRTSSGKIDVEFTKY